MTDEISPRIFRRIAAVFVVGFGILLLDSSRGGLGGSDAAGYANTAKDILNGRIVVPVEAPARLGLDAGWSFVFVPLAEHEGPWAGTMVPFYPPGFPLHIALFALVAGWEAGPFWVSPILAIAALLLTYALARELTLSRPLAFAAGAMLAACSPFLFHAIQPMSDVAATAWSTAAVLCALKARRRTGWAAASGAALGMAVLIRPADALLLLPLALALPWWRQPFALFVAAGLPFAAFYGWWNQVTYGSAFRTGYSGLLATDLRLSNFWPRAARYGGWIVRQLTPLVPIGWVGVSANRRVPARDRALLLSWFAAFFLFYSFWMSSVDGWTYGRYLLPAAPALLIGFLLCVRDAARGLANRRVTVRERAVSFATLTLAVVVAAVLFVERRVERRLRPLGSAHGQVVYPDGCRRLIELVPDGKALVVSMEFSAAIRFYTPLTPVRWDLLSPELFAGIRAKAAEKGYRVLAVLFPHEARAAAAAPGNWNFLGNVGAASIWELPPPSQSLNGPPLGSTGEISLP